MFCALSYEVIIIIHHKKASNYIFFSLERYLIPTIIFNRSFKMSFMENFSTATNITNLHMCSTDDGGGNSPTTTSHTCSHMEKP